MISFRTLKGFKIKPQQKKQTVFFTFMFCMSFVQANDELNFEQHKIPNAECGDGSPYYTYIREGDPKKVIVHFQGGGACWDALTCFGPKPLTRLKDSGFPNAAAVFNSLNSAGHPFTDYTYIFMPYCTGDIFSGTHVKTYAPTKKAKHYGRLNTEKALQHIEAEFGNPISDAEKLVVYGDSAGALGAMLNLDLIDALSSNVSDRTLIPDSPGLHYNKIIWDRFTKEYLADLAQSLSRNGMKFDKNTGLVSKQSNEFCEHFSKWKVGYIQSTKDIVMSVVFGTRTQNDHRNQVLGFSGLYFQTLPKSDACSALIPDNAKHVHSLNKDTWSFAVGDGTRVSEFVNSLVENRLADEFPNHR